MLFRSTIARQAHLFMGFPKQEYWSGLPFPTPGALPDPGIEFATPALAGGTTASPGKPQQTHKSMQCNKEPRNKPITYGQ